MAAKARRQAGASRSSGSPVPARRAKSSSETSLCHGKEVDNFTWCVIAIAGGEDGKAVGAGRGPQIGRALTRPAFRSTAGRAASVTRVDHPGWEKVVRSPRCANRLSSRTRDPAGRAAAACRPATDRPSDEQKKPTRPLTGLPGSPKTSAGGRSPRGGPIPNQSGLPGLRRTL